MSDLPDHYFRQALDKSLDMVMILKANYSDVGASEIVYINQTFTETMGYRASEVIGENPRMFQGNDTDRRTRLDIRIALKQKQSIQRKILNFTKSGEPIWLDIHFIPLTNDANETTHFLAVEKVHQTD